MQNFFNQETIEELKARLKWIQVLGSEKKVFLAFDHDQISDAEFRPIKAVTLMISDNSQHKLLDIGFQYKGIGKTLIVRNICAFNWCVLDRSSDEVSSETARLTLFCLANNPSSGQKLVTKSYLLKFTNCPAKELFSEDYVMIS